MFFWEDIKETDGGIGWGILLKWSGRHCQSTVCWPWLCGQVYCLVVFWDLVGGSKILSTVIVYLATLFCCCIGLSICIYGMILCSRRCITSWWILKRCGIGQVGCVPALLPWGDMGYISFLCVYISVSYHLSCSSPRWDNLPSGHQRNPLLGLILCYMYWGQKNLLNKLKNTSTCRIKRCMYWWFFSRFKGKKYVA